MFHKIGTMTRPWMFHTFVAIFSIIFTIIGIRYSINSATFILDKGILMGNAITMALFTISMMMTAIMRSNATWFGTFNIVNTCAFFTTIQLAGYVLHNAHYHPITQLAAVAMFVPLIGLILAYHAANFIAPKMHRWFVKLNNPTVDA